ncbi:hypothetical protein F4821DRAFT_247568 [Hypoxylon rubiginosum]|uniref:Uncharacterized protein n=1 Tax=Hypoxylon rubiginosum TaxID=110542 RepID=A0ACC0CPD7_9PEZI|nr:hypothetical protein F4821DRAFT_247568 [Hypoxylon rubiginosum]
MDGHTAKEEELQASLTTRTVDTEQTLVLFLQTIRDLPANPPSIFLDAEGMHDGKANVLALFIPHLNMLYRIKLQGKRSIDISFQSPTGDSLKALLESESNPKVVFDVRQLSQAVYHQHNISLNGIRDLQLMELASREAKQSKKYVKGLVKCVEQDLSLSNEIRQRWLGTDNVDEYRISNILGRAPRSSVKRIEMFPALWEVYYAKLRRPAQAFWLAQSQWESQMRVVASQLPKFESNALGPEVWYDHEQREYAMDRWNEEKSLGIIIGVVALEGGDKGKGKGKQRK